MGAWIEIRKTKAVEMELSVAPLVGAWIEIIAWLDYETVAKVAPLVGAWIEMVFVPPYPSFKLSSLPLWERGLKLLFGLPG